MRVVLTDAAEADLERIGDQIAEHSPRRAVTFVVELREACGGLAEMPERFPLTPRFERSGVRRRVHGNYLVFYRIGPGSIEVLHVLHGAMDYEPLVFPNG
jgi:toxin ParE1/3/4